MTKKIHERTSSVKRKTSETQIQVNVNLDGTGKHLITTGLPFFDHMIQQLSKHSLVDIDIKCDGDLEIDSHHTIEDVGWTLGKAINEALGNKQGIKRYSFNYLPMDECLTRCCIDISGRPWLVWNVFLPTVTIKDIETEIFREFFQSFSQSAEITIHIENIYGQNTHHIIESCFKSMAISLRNAIKLDFRNLDSVPSTKGTLTGKK